MIRKHETIGNGKGALMYILKIVAICIVIVALFLTAIGIGIGVSFIKPYLQNQIAKEAQAATTTDEVKTVEVGKATEETAAPVETTATTETAATVETTAVETTVAETVATETTEEKVVKDNKVYPYIVEQENGVPKNGNKLTISVGFNDLGYASMGPVELFGMKFQGGQDSEGKDIGNITILLGTAGQKTNYTLNSVDNGNVYWKVVRHETAPVQADIDKMINQGVIDFNKEGNGTSGNGVDKGYIIIANPEGILKTIYFEVENGVIQVMQEVKL